MVRGNASDSSSSSPEQSQSGSGANEEDADGNKQSPSNTTLHPERNYMLEDLNLEEVPNTLRPRNNADLNQAPQLELVGHSVTFGTNPYDVYYGGMMAAYGQQLLPPPLYGMHHHGKVTMNLEMTQEPVYVNAKQYNAIMRRRQSRAKAELERKLIKARKPYLHESRHQHALRRERSTGGRFASKKSNNDKSDTSEMRNSGSITSSQSFGSSCGANVVGAQNLYNPDKVGGFGKQTSSQEPTCQP